MTALLLAAGLGSRMGPAGKLTLPFGTSTVVGETVRALVRAGVFARIVVVTGHAADDVEVAVFDALGATSEQVQTSPLGPGALGEHALPGLRTAARTTQVGTARRAVCGQRAAGSTHGEAPQATASERPPVVMVVHNAAFADGMSRSIAAGAQDVPEGEPVAVMLGDLPLVRPETIRRLTGALDGPADVVRPSYRGVPGHPVVFGADHLPALRTLAPGDAGARDLARSARCIGVDDAGVVTDLDTRDAYDAASGTQRSVRANHPADPFPTE